MSKDDPETWKEEPQGGNRRTQPRRPMNPRAGRNDAKAPAAIATMLVIENPSTRLNTGERAFIAHQRGKKGIALLNFMVGGGGPRKPGREVDAIMILPHGIFAVEVKHTSAVGVLDAPLNDSWSVGDISTPFSSKDRTPAAQADQAAKILASHLASKDWPKGYITPVVSISGKVTVPDHVAWVGTVGVCTVEHFDLVVKQAKSKRIQARHVGPMLMRLGVSAARVPSMGRLLDEGFAPTPQDDAAETSTETGVRPSTPPAKPSPSRRRPEPQRPKPPLGVPSPLTLAATLNRSAADVEPTSTEGVPAEPEQSEADSESPETESPESEPSVGVEPRRGPHRRAWRWLHDPLGKDRATTVRTGALTSLVVLLGVWQLMAGDLFMRLIGPEPGHFYFIYGTWQTSWRSVEDSGLPGWSAFAAPIVGAVLIVLFCIAQWLRLNVGGATRLGIGAFWVSVFSLIIASPVLFAGLGWAGVWVTWLAYTVVWPLSAIVINEVKKSALYSDPDKVWNSYEI